ncbi:MAG: N-acetylmuramoyl-L-alanine amidase [Alphaproteobacteria bacterium]|nr:N-acetylmuramoyl-L-alanine amidase [Alphaproteobacteria bacterium]MDE2353021.1 N-acetylmuramoyl-L-alanine amidase [Alphaproteobacteria bacterium]
MRLIERPSPNRDARPEGTPIDLLVLHYTGMKTAEEAVERLCDPASQVSAHYTIDTEGTVFAHVPEALRAWHAGVSYWAGARGLNARSIGIELANPGHEFGYVPFPKAQIEALVDLADGIMSRHAIPAARVLGHSDIAPARKQDPGELFPWKGLADFGIGIWPEHSARALDLPVEQALAEIGYGVAPEVEVTLEQVLGAFQRHFVPESVTGEADPETQRRIAAVHALVTAPA